MKTKNKLSLKEAKFAPVLREDSSSLQKLKPLKEAKSNLKETAAIEIVSMLKAAKLGEVHTAGSQILVVLPNYDQGNSKFTISLEVKNAILTPRPS